MRDPASWTDRLLSPSHLVVAAVAAARGGGARADDEDGREPGPGAAGLFREPGPGAAGLFLPVDCDACRTTGLDGSTHLYKERAVAFWNPRHRVFMRLNEAGELDCEDRSRGSAAFCAECWETHSGSEESSSDIVGANFAWEWALRFRGARRSHLRHTDVLSDSSSSPRSQAPGRPYVYATPPINCPCLPTSHKFARRAAVRPCIDLHGGKVKQIVGSTLSDDASSAPVENFVASRSAAEFAELYRRDGLAGGHVIMLGPGNEEAALSALRAYPGGLQVGGGVTAANAATYLAAGASHVIVTSYVFRDGRLDEGRLAEIEAAVGRERLVLDLSCRRRAPGGPFFVVTDRWQKFTELEVCAATLAALGGRCAEFLVHAVDVEGKQSGVERELVEALGEWSPIPVTYAGGARDRADLELVARLGKGRVCVTVGSALDIFGGKLPYAEVVAWSQEVSKGGGAEPGAP